MIVAANPADAAGNEMRVARVFPLHENAIAAKDRRRAVTLGDPAVLEVDLSVDAQTADDPCDRVPIHLDQRASRRRGRAFALYFAYKFGHVHVPFVRVGARIP